MYSPHVQPAVSGASSGSRESTRDNVLNSVLTHGPVSAATIGDQLQLTAAAVRRHLDSLEKDGLVEVKSVAGSRGAGRPSRRYVVTQQGQSHLGDDYLDLASEAVRLLQEISGDEAIRSLARKHFASLEQRFSELVPEDADLTDRIRALTRTLDEAGFAASTRRAGRGGKVTTLRAAQICQGHCPIQEMAGEFPEFCEEETELFARLLEVDVRRLSTLPTGGHVCTTHVPLGRRAHASLIAHTAQRAEK
ncbi:helix-turn-helix transcriptional regulator [Citricoccus sp. NR2]|uniref:helix-turn-helix transcriptional regulator n=1 Tax=Citricoccus sp. NR2 TaxID=3004095 RepID=UPI0022DE1633|nr:helix-turn-helix domain-containing protein [Citricoccus sp. NR2]WBL18315.1 MarR family transcriptional regulator [Citricoccus sp. NR2]